MNNLNSILIEGVVKSLSETGNDFVLRLKRKKKSRDSFIDVLVELTDAVRQLEAVKHLSIKDYVRVVGHLDHPETGGDGLVVVAEHLERRGFKRV